MAEKKVEQVTVESEFIEPSLDSLIDEAVAKSEKVESEPKKEETSEIKSEIVIDKENKVAEVKPEKELKIKPEGVKEKETEKKDLTNEEFDQLCLKHPELQDYKKSFDNYEKWEKTLRQKSQFIPWFKDLTPEQQELIVNKNLSYVYNKEEMPKSPKELVDEVIKKVTIDDLKYVDDDELEVVVPKEKIEPLLHNAIEAVLNNGMPEMAVMRKNITDLTNKVQELTQQNEISTSRLGEIELESLIKNHSVLEVKKINDDESLLEVVNRINEAGKEHPEYKILDKIRAIGNNATRNNYTLEKSYNDLYGGEEKLIKEKEMTNTAILENQKGATQETPGGEKIIKEDWENECNDMDSHESKVDEMFS